jgi:hypothetical protein
MRARRAEMLIKFVKIWDRGEDEVAVTLETHDLLMVPRIGETVQIVASPYGLAKLEVNDVQHDLSDGTHRVILREHVFLGGMEHAAANRAAIDAVCKHVDDGWTMGSIYWPGIRADLEDAGYLKER